MSQPIQASMDTESPSPRHHVRELALSAAWHGGLTHNLETVTGSHVRIIFRGQWSHGYGPDFSGAILEVDGAEMATGAVEIHLQSSDWNRHGHHLDPAYNDVILHIVTRNDGAKTRRQDGAIVPTVVLDIDDQQLFLIDRELPEIWAELGGDACAPDLASREPHRIQQALSRLGDARFDQRVTRFAGDLTVEPLRQVLLRGLFDAFGYSMNREPMGRLFSLADEVGLWTRLESRSAEARHTEALAVLFGLAGFLPLAPIDANLAGLPPETVPDVERLWQETYGFAAGSSLAPTSWSRARTRPANHPVARLSALSTLLSNTDGDPTHGLIAALREGQSVPERIAKLCRHPGRPALGKSRATAIAATVVLPALMAWSQHNQDDDLEDAVSQAWHRLPRSEWSRAARRALAQAAGEVPIGPLTERPIQGLLHLDRDFCAPRRCYECPVAAEVIADRKRRRKDGDSIVQSMLPT